MLIYTVVDCQFMDAEATAASRAADAALINGALVSNWVDSSDDEEDKKTWMKVKVSLYCYTTCGCYHCNLHGYHCSRIKV